MRRPQGYAVISDPGSRVQVRECDTFTCAHCQRIVFVKPRASASDCGGWCGCCGKPICGPCAAKGECTPFLKRLEEAEKCGRF